jgi:hypothetical protein
MKKIKNTPADTYSANSVISNSPSPDSVAFALSMLFSADSIVFTNFILHSLHVSKWLNAAEHPWVALGGVPPNCASSS